MARVLYGATVTAINGSIGGTTFQRNRYGSSAKNKPIIAFPNSPDVNAIKLLMQTAATEWRELTASNRATWNNWAQTNPIPTRLNPNAYLNGFNLFVKYHLIRWLAGVGTPLANPTFTLATLNNISISTRRVGATFRTEVSVNVTTPDWVGYQFTSGLVTASSYVSSNPTRYMINQPMAFGTTFFDLTTVYEDKFGTLPAVNDYVISDFTFIRTTAPQIVESGAIKSIVTV
jgi:hypothetical protein